MTPTIPEIERLLADARPSSVAGYFVTSSGDVISTINWRGYGPRKLTPYPNSHGYPAVKVKFMGKMKKMLIHKEICLAFHGPKLRDDLEVRHINGDRADNRADNLAWGTRSQNAQDRVAHGTCMAAVMAGLSLGKHPRRIVVGSKKKGRIMALSNDEIQEMLNASTPGPWVASASVVYTGKIGALKDDGKPNWGGFDLYSTPNAIEDARLIASTPDLAHLAIDQARELEAKDTRIAYLENMRAADDAVIEAKDARIAELEDVLKSTHDRLHSACHDQYDGVWTDAAFDEELGPARAALKEQPE